MSRMSGNEKWTVIANPKAGSRRFFQRKSSIEKRLEKAGLDAEIIVTEYAGHATVLVKRLLEEENVRHLIVAGGDGSVSEVVDGIFSSSVDPSEVTLAIMPGGTGNDWARYWGIPKKARKSIPFIVDGYTRRVDVGRLSYFYQGEQKVKYFINSVGMGFDAQVVYYTELISRFLPGRSWVYSLAVLMGALMHSSKPLRLELDGAGCVVDDAVYTISIANGPYTGGGIKQTPDAVPTDGFFDLFVVVRPSFFLLIKSLYRLFKKRLEGNSCLRFFRSSSLRIVCSNKNKVEADGILLEGAEGPFDLELLPNALRMVVPKDFVE